MVRLSETPATTPVIVASCADVSRFRACTLMVSEARERSGSDSVDDTCGDPISTGPLRTMSTPRQGPMLLSGGVGFQSTQPIDRLNLGSAGCTRNARVLLPTCTHRVTSNSCTGYAPATTAWSATRLPFNQTSALAIMPLIRSSVRVACPPSATVNSVRYHQGIRNTLPLESGSSA